MFSCFFVASILTPALTVEARSAIPLPRFRLEFGITILSTCSKNPVPAFPGFSVLLRPFLLSLTRVYIAVSMHLNLAGSVSATPMLVCNVWHFFLGRSLLCLDAFIVSLNQACEGGKKRWYASTLELQQVSLEFCRACRSVPTLRIRVEGKTPVSLWLRFDPQHLLVPASSRVPLVRALALRWALPMDCLRQKAAIELWDWSEDLVLTELRLRVASKQWFGPSASSGSG